MRKGEGGGGGERRIKEGERESKGVWARGREGVWRRCEREDVREKL